MAFARLRATATLASNTSVVMPAKAGIQSFGDAMDSRFRGNDNL
jgi:hypothetical protein